MIEHDEVMNSCNAKARLVGLANLTEVERVIVLVNMVHFEVVMGGFSQFYYNSDGNEGTEAVPALEAVGAFRSAAARRQANALFHGGSPSSDQEQRCDQLRAIADAGSLSALDSSFCEEDQFKLLCSYIESHVDQLREHCSG